LQLVFGEIVQINTNIGIAVSKSGGDEFRLLISEVIQEKFLSFGFEYLLISIYIIYGKIPILSSTFFTFFTIFFIFFVSYCK